MPMLDVAYTSYAAARQPPCYRQKERAWCAAAATRVRERAAAPMLLLRCYCFEYVFRHAYAATVTMMAPFLL